MANYKTCIDECIALYTSTRSSYLKGGENRKTGLKGRIESKFLMTQSGLVVLNIYRKLKIQAVASVSCAVERRLCEHKRSSLLGLRAATWFITFQVDALLQSVGLNTLCAIEITRFLGSTRLRPAGAVLFVQKTRLDAEQQCLWCDRTYVTGANFCSVDALTIALLDLRHHIGPWDSA